MTINKQYIIESIEQGFIKGLGYCNTLHADIYTEHLGSNQHRIIAVYRSASFKYEELITFTSNQEAN